VILAGVSVQRFSLLASERERTRLAALLSADERARAARLRRAEDRLRFVVARARLRLLLARHAGGAAEDLRFAYGPFGKPSLPECGSLRFNLAHAADTALLAIAAGREVGIDLEPLDRGRDLEDVARTFFSPAERAALAALAPPRRAAAIMRCWCRKEAYVKARGDGLTRSLATFDVAVDGGADGDANGSLLLATRPDAAEARAWDVRDLAVGARHVAALAVEGPLERTPDVVDAAGVWRDPSARSM
jgi:4'-phosphopantetheinyl transferase